MRLFVALDPPEEIRATLARLTMMLPLPRRVAPDALHLTLAFLGEVAQDRFEALDLALAAIAAPPFTLRLEGAGLFGGARPRVAWAGVAPCPALDALQRRVTGALHHAGLAPEARRFTPHVTLGRFAPGSASAPALEGAVAGAAGFCAGPWEVAELTLFRSTLAPGGARYDVLARYPLGG